MKLIYEETGELRRRCVLIVLCSDERVIGARRASVGDTERRGGGAQALSGRGRAERGETQLSGRLRQQAMLVVGGDHGGDEANVLSSRELSVSLGDQLVTQNT